jgi:broad specificity polyphosphatase/5'/3'-nucleotidase SurE
MAQIYCALGIIPSNKFKYVKATDMIGDHVGATKHMTQAVIDEADGGVLFIDEAYSLSTSETKDPYGKDYYWLTGEFVNFEPESTDTDEWALANGYVSVVPIQADMTAHKYINDLKFLE